MKQILCSIFRNPMPVFFILLLINPVHHSLAADHDHGHDKSERQLDKDDESKGPRHQDHEHHSSRQEPLKTDHKQSHKANDEHEDHEKHEEPKLKFSANELEEFSIKLENATLGIISKTLDLTGDVIVAPELLYHVVPRVSGVVRQVYKHLGDKVNAGDLLATLSSRELADAKANFVALDSLLKLANANLKRERGLYKSKVTAKREYLAAKQVQAEISIKRKAAQQRLLSIGLSQKAVSSVLKNADKDLTLYELRAPADGVIIEKHAAQGEVLETTVRSFTLANLSQVWVNLTVYQKDLPFIQKGQHVLISTRYGLHTKQTTASTINWLSPTLDDQTRSAIARVIIDNPDGYWRPGLFVSGIVAIEKYPAKIIVPLSALQTIDGQVVVFVQHARGSFEPQVIQTGRRDHQNVEILQGLKIGQSYVSDNTFSLKAQLQKSEFDHGHHH